MYLFVRYLVFCLIGLVFLSTISFGQSLGTYTTTRNTGVSYLSINVTGNPLNSWRNSTSLPQDDNRSNFTDIGFDFWYNGVRYTQFSASTNGFMDFSSSTNDGGPIGNAFGYDNTGFTSNNTTLSTNPAIAPFYDDLTAQGGTSALGNSIKYYVSGSAPSRTLTVEWINMAVYGNTTPSLNFQVKLVETTGVIIVNYGVMNAGTFTFSYSMGLNGQTISSPPLATQLKELQTANSNTFSNTIQNGLSAMPATNSQYVFTPRVPTAAAGTLVFTAIGQTGMTVNWPNWATNEVGYVIYNSTDNTNFNFVVQTASNTASSAITGLIPSTTYYWKVFAVTEGCLSAALTGTQATLAAGNKISRVTGMWNTATTWSPTGVPTAADNVTIANGHTVTINTDAICNNLTVGQGTSGALSIGNNNTIRSVAINGTVNIRAGGTFNVSTGSNRTHKMTLKGDVVNNGTLNFATDGNSFCDVSFEKLVNQTISGSGVTTTFNNITVNIGISASTILDVQTPNFVASNGFLTLTSGTFKLSTSGASNLTAFTVASTIPQKAGLWLNSALSTINTEATLTMYGNVTLSNGILNIGNAANQDLESNGGYLSITNGTLNIAGKYYAAGINNTSNFAISGGNVIVPSISSTSTTDAPFQIVGAGSQFNMSGGTIFIPREGGGGPQNLGFVNTGTNGGSVTGGTLQIGSAVSPANQIIQINSLFPVGNLVIGSANVNASLLTNTLSVINHVTINSGTLTANNLNLSLGGNWNNGGGLFVPGTGNVEFLGTSAQTIYKSGGETFNNISFSSAGAKTLLSAIIASNVSITTGSNLDVTASNYQVSVKGNFTNSGTFNAQKGLVLLNGTVAQSIGGTTITNFYDLSLNNTTGATITNSENLIGTLTLSNGTFNTNSNVFTMVSTATNTARVAQIATTANIIGNVTVQRYAPGGYTGWALLGTPISSALTLQDWDDDIFISCNSCPDGSAAGFVSIYTYNEAATGSYTSGASYVAMTAITNPITPDKGYWVYLGTGATSTTPITLDVTGTLRKFNNTIPLTRTNTGSPSDDGWNLIHNPYPSPIRWSLLKGATTGIDNAIYTYNADLNGGLGASVSYVNGVSSPAVGAGGIGDTIPMCQGFFVHSTGATALNATEANKVGGNPTFLRMNNSATVSSSPMPLMRLYLDGGSNFHDETVVYLQAGATNQFDEQYDAIKMAGQDPSAPTICGDDGITEFQINAIDFVTSSVSLPIKTTTGYAGTYTISLANFGSFPTGACISLFDAVTGITTNLKTGNYVFTLNSTTTNARFMLTITLDPLTVTSTIISHPNCAEPNAGQITVVGNSSGPWNYFWKDETGAIIRTSMNRSTADTLPNLYGGDYYVDVNTVGQCDNSNSTFFLNTSVAAVAQFNVVDTFDLSNGSTVPFYNNSTAAQTFDWNFGDNLGTAFNSDPTYAYLTTGSYTVLLIVTSSSGCIDSTTKTIVIVNNPVGIKEALHENDIILKTLPNNQFILQTSNSNYSLVITDNAGRLIVDYGNITEQNQSPTIDLNGFKIGIYYLNIKYTNGSSSKILKLLVK